MATPKSAKKKPGELVDAAAMRALAHPLKWALMEVLLVEGSATSTRCAEVVGDTQANCSFHLRQLARYGLVEAAPTSSKRDRPWRMASTDQSWSRVQPDETRARAASELERVFIQHEMAKLMRWERSSHTYPEGWRRAALRTGAQTWLTEAELAELADQISDLMFTYRDRLQDPSKRPDGSRPVRLFAVGYPLPENP
jgi:predicted ArsR family transcriptional regulator